MIYKKYYGHKERVNHNKYKENPSTKILVNDIGFDKHIEKDYKNIQLDFLLKEICKTKIKDLSVINALIQKKIPGAHKVTKAQLAYYKNKYSSEKGDEVENKKSNVESDTVDKNYGDR